MLYLLVVAGGMLGGMGRLLVSRAVQSLGGDFPYGTLVVNWSGSLLVGIVSSVAVHGALSAPFAALLVSGFIASYTTFSTFSYETVQILVDGRRLEALMNALVSAAGAAALVWIGAQIA